MPGRAFLVFFDRSDHLGAGHVEDVETTPAAIGIAEGAKGGEYTSIENFQARTGANSAVIKALAEAGCLNGLPETDQLCLF